jgi:hypothetical protein
VNHFATAAAGGELAETLGAGEREICLGRSQANQEKDPGNEKDIGFHEIFDGCRILAVALTGAVEQMVQQPGRKTLAANARHGYSP